MSGLFSKLINRGASSRSTDRSGPTPSHSTASAPPVESATPDDGLASSFHADHVRCDALWADVEGADGDAAVKTAFETFDTAMRRHLAMEEEVIFPAFEDATGMHGCGPTAMMCMEHEQMRGLLGAMDRAVQASDTDTVLGQGDTLLMLIQQHNMKEEQILYPMAEGHLAARWPELQASLERY